MSTEQPRKIAFARKLRRAMTEPERVLWARLKSRDAGLVFKRQQPIGPYVLDFYCYEARLAIEFDGGLHDANKDAVRDAYFLNEAIETYRIPASEVYRRADAVADGIKLMARSRIEGKSRK